MKISSLIIEKQFPQATVPFLRFQAGVYCNRAKKVPVYIGRRVAYETTTGKTVDTFRLLGWSAVSQQDANQKAIIALANLQRRGRAEARTRRSIAGAIASGCLARLHPSDYPLGTGLARTSLSPQW